MTTNHTKELDDQIIEVQITPLDSCKYYEPKEGSLLLVDLCAFCRFGQFDDPHKNGRCQYKSNKSRR